ncbi:unnamed protein product [Polarella glacialis]|uniref:F-box domain-containing protein n=1 Tax=Polarella glacialis TaxID=89957 RepID=A0A813JC31_POLGL|nr:unnamed protein product [Polarella glacialis]
MASQRGKLVLADVFGMPLEHVLSFVPVESVVAAISSSKFLEIVAGSDAVWGSKCHELWYDKAYVPQHFRETGGMSCLAAYWGSLTDSRRCSITAEELCSFEWSARMKGWSGPDWTSGDAWWQGQPASVRYFHTDGTTYSPERGEGQWRFVPSACGQTGPEGSFLRLSRGGRDYPTHFVTRWAKSWGWILHNCWGFCTSFPLPRKGAVPELEDDGQICQEVTVETCRDEAMRFNMGLPLPFENAGTDGDEAIVSITIDGREVRLPANVAAAIFRHQQLDVDSADEEDSENEEQSVDEEDEEANVAETNFLG